MEKKQSLSDRVYIRSFGHMTMAEREKYIFNLMGVLARKTVLQHYSTLKKDLSVLSHCLSFLAHCFLFCFRGSCVDLAAKFSIFNLCISCSIPIFHLFGPLFMISLFFSGLFPYNPSFFVSVFYTLLSLLAFYSLLLLAFSLHFPLFTFFLPVGLWRNTLRKEVTCMIFLWKQEHIYSNRSQHIDLQYQIVDEFNLIQTKLMCL